MHFHASGNGIAIHKNSLATDLRIHLWYGCLAFALLVRKIRFVLKLGVNIDHVATLREARYRQTPRRSGLIPEPDPVLAAKICEEAGAHGITVHLREDRRHIHDHDLRRLRATVRTRLNLEMAATTEILSIALQIRPDITCIVPEKRTEVTTEGGLDVRVHRRSLTQAIQKLHGKKIPVSLFIDSNPRQISAAADVGADFVELHTGAYANAHPMSQPKELKRLIEGARFAHSLGLLVNAGHGINYQNIRGILKIPHLVELNIGHSIISRAIFVGLKRAVQEMLAAVKPYAKGHNGNLV